MIEPLSFTKLNKIENNFVRMPNVGSFVFLGLSYMKEWNQPSSINIQSHSSDSQKNRGLLNSCLLIFGLILFMTSNLVAQKFYLGNYLSPTGNEFELLGISSKTGVTTYRYKKEIYDSFFGREIGDIVVGIRNEHITLTIYNLIPYSSDIGVPKEVINLIQKSIPYPFKEVNGVYGLNIDNESISVTRVTNSLTFGKDRIMFMNSIKQSVLENTKKD